MGSLEAGARPFASLSKDAILKALRQLLALIGVQDAELYGTHNCRRGHSDDMVRAGRGLAEILVAGGWRSAGGHKPYTDRVDLEMRACLEAHFAMLDEPDQ